MQKNIFTTFVVFQQFFFDWGVVPPPGAITEMYRISDGLLPEFMVEIEIYFPYYARLSCQVEVDIDGNITDFTKNSNY